MPTDVAPAPTARRRGAGTLTARVRHRVARSSRWRRLLLAIAVLGPAVGAALRSDAAPTGLGGVDDVWTGAAVAAVGYLAATARRWTWFVPAGAAAALAGDRVAVAVAAVAIVVALLSVATNTRSRHRGALVGGLGAAGLMLADPVGFHGATALVTAVSVVPVLASGYRHAGRRSQRLVRRVAGSVGIAAALLVVGAGLGVVSTQGDLVEGARLIDDGMSAARETDDDVAADRLNRAARHLSSADATLSSWFVEPARLLPVVGPNIASVESLAHEASRVAEVSSLGVESADVDALRFVDGRLDPQAALSLIEPLEESLAAVEQLQATLDDSVESPWVIAPLRHRMDLLGGQIDEAVPDAEAALAALDAAPTLLGALTPQRYLVLFVTPVEARGRTGFPGNFAELVIDDGALSMPRFGRISELEEGGIPGPQRELTEPPELVARYGRFDPATTWRNLTMSPDFPSVAAAARQLYPQSGGTEIDGVLAIDPMGLAQLLRYTGPVEVDGLATPLDAANAAQFLVLDQYVTQPDVSRRVDLLEEVARTTFERLTQADLPGPRALVERLDPLVDGGHISFTTFDAHTFMYLESIGVTGRLGDVAGDSLAVTTSNAGGSKIDVFLRRQLDYDVTWDPASGRVTGTITATLTNEAPTTGLPDYVIGNVIGLPRGTNRSYLSIYTPHEATATRVDGEPAAIGSGRELDRNVYSTFLDIPPGGTVTVELDVQGTVEGRYRLDLAPQPLVDPEQVDVSVAVVGDAPLTGDGVEIADHTATWHGALDRRVALSVGPVAE